MANKKISELTSTSDANGTEQFEVLKGGATFRMTLADLMEPHFLALAVSEVAPRARVLEFEDDVFETTDGGPGAAYAVALVEGGIENSKLADMAEATFKGRNEGAGTGPPQDLTVAQVVAILGESFTSDAAGDEGDIQFNSGEDTMDADADLNWNALDNILSIATGLYDNGTIRIGGDAGVGTIDAGNGVLVMVSDVDAQLVAGSYEYPTHRVALNPLGVSGVYVESNDGPVEIETGVYGSHVALITDSISRLKIDGDGAFLIGMAEDAGEPGQVLTSGGPGIEPTWENSGGEGTLPADPGADSFLFWDDSDGNAIWVQNVPTLDAASNLFTNNGGPWITLSDADATSGLRKFRMRSLNGVFSIATESDAGSAVETAIGITRNTSSEVTEIAFAGDSLSFTGPIVTPGTTAFEVGYNGAPQNVQNGDYTLVLLDRGKSIDKQSGGGGETITIPADSGGVAFPIGTVICGDNDGGGSLTIAITSDTLETSAGLTGSRTIGDNGSWAIKKIASTKWRITGTNMT